MPPKDSQIAFMKKNNTHSIFIYTYNIDNLDQYSTRTSGPLIKPKILYTPKTDPRAERVNV